MIGVCFADILKMSSSDLMSQYCVSKVFLDSRLKYESLEPFIKFVAFLVQKLCQKNSKYFRNSLRHLGDFPN